MRALKKLGDYINKLTGLMIVVIFTVMIAACVLQVFTRYVLNNSLSWTEELARFAFIWSNMLGAAICVSKCSHATVTAVYDLFPEKVRKIVTVVNQTIIAAVAFVMVYYGFKVTYITRMQTSPAIKMNMSIINSAIPICGLFILVHAIIHIAEGIAAFSEKGESK